MVNHLQSGKTDALLFSLKQAESTPSQIFGNTPVKFAYGHTRLGLAFSNNGQWYRYIVNIVTSAAKVIGILGKLKFSSSRIALNQIFFHTFYPYELVLEYSSVVSEVSVGQDMKK